MSKINEFTDYMASEIEDRLWDWKTKHFPYCESVVIRREWYSHHIWQVRSDSIESADLKLQMICIFNYINQGKFQLHQYVLLGMEKICLWLCSGFHAWGLFGLGKRLKWHECETRQEWQIIYKYWWAGVPWLRPSIDLTFLFIIYIATSVLGQSPSVH